MNCIAGDARRNDISYHHVALGVEMLPLMVLDPLMHWKDRPL
jgi:hypothetical protein